MGILIKGLLFFFVFVWIIRSVLRFFLGGLFGSGQQRSFHQRTHRPQEANGGNVHVNRSPNKSRKNKTSDDFKGGDYIDYEEVD
jgi:hypothetical protein